jgi:ribosomal protein S18 acetylase RimI-like enzyme
VNGVSFGERSEPKEKPQPDPDVTYQPRPCGSQAARARFSMKPHPSTRLVTADDADFLWEMLYWAAHADEDVGVGPDDVRRDPDLIGYASGWGRRGDLGVVAEIDGRRVGAAWLRLFDPDTSDYRVFVDDLTPELVAAVAPGHHGRGVGTLLLTTLFDHADPEFPASVLSVRADNPAVRLYERFGYREVDRIVNRVGTESLRMTRTARRATPPGT